MRNRNVTVCAASAAFLFLAAAVPALDDYYPRPSPGNFREPNPPPPAPDSARDAVPVPSGDLPPPIPAVPGVPPRMVMRNDVEEAASAAGAAIRRGSASLYRVVLDSGSVLAVTPPVRAGSDGVGVFRLTDDGGVRRDTLPLERIRAIEIPYGFGGPMDWVAFTGLMILPAAFAGGIPVPVLYGMGAGVAAVGQAPRWTSRPPVDFLDQPDAWSATLAVTQGLVSRTTLNPADPRAQAARALRLQAEGGPRWSPVTFGLGLRMVSMGSPMNGGEVHDSAWTGYDSRRDDSAYAARGMAFAISPAIAIVWAESPVYTLRTRAGGFFSLTPYPAGRYLDGSARASGPEFGLELDLRPAEHWGLRLEAAFLSPADEDEDLPLEPSVGVGLAYALHARPAPTRAHGVLASFSAAFSGDEFVPGLQLEQDLDEWQSLGLCAAFAQDRRIQTSRVDAVTWSWQESRWWSTTMAFTWGVHSNRSARAYVGAQLVAGLTTKRIVDRFESNYLQFDGTPQASRYGNRGINSDVALAFIPEAGLRLGAGFGMRLRLHPLEGDPFSADENFKASAGLTYALPVGGAGR